MSFLHRTLSATLPCLLALATLSATAQDWAKAKLDASPRHREYVAIEHGGRTVNTYVVFPEVKGKAPVVVMIHEIFGLTDWARLQADELASQGYVVVEPDLLSGMGADGGGTDSFGGQENAMKAVSKLDPVQVMADLQAAADYGKKLPAAGNKLFVTGFCWGGGKTFEFATLRQDLSGAFVFYGPPPPAAAMAQINTPVYGFYAENDARIGATIPQTVIDMKAAGKFYQPITYAGAGHGFMRAGQSPEAKPADADAFRDGYARLLRELKARTAGPIKTSSRANRHAKVVAAAVHSAGHANQTAECAHGAM